jgi:hypothetical protein
MPLRHMEALELEGRGHMDRKQGIFIFMFV